MTKHAPKLTVLITTYNKEAYIAQTVESVLAQTEPDLEVLVVDDASADGTCDVVRDLMRRDPRVRLLALAENGRQPAALNRGIEAAAGEWVAVLDGDDWVAPDHYASVLALAEATGVSVASSNMQWVEGAELPMWKRLLSPIQVRPLVLTTAQFIRRSMPYDILPLSFLQPVIRRELLLAHNVRYHPTDTFDLDFGILVKCLLAGGRMAVSPKATYFYRQVPGSLMSNRRPETLQRMKDSNDALIPLCVHYGDRDAVRLIGRRSRAVAREIKRAELVALIRLHAWRRAIARVAISPRDVSALAVRRVRWPMFSCWRRLCLVMIAVQEMFGPGGLT